MTYPKHIALEVVSGYCTCKCTMCSIGEFERKKQIMTDEQFQKVIEKISPYYKYLDTFSFVGMGETLIDKNIGNKIKVLKNSGCKANVAIVTNCTNLDKDMSEKLLKSGLNLIICSIDGMYKKTHENIRNGSDFDVIKANVLNFIKMRKEIIYSRTRILIRFIRQQSNKDELEMFKAYWNEQLDQSYGDEITSVDVHNFGGDTENYDEIKIYDMSVDQLNAGIDYCKDLTLAMSIYGDGTVPLCCVDTNADFAKSSNIFECSYEEAYNSEARIHHREMIEAGKINELKNCKNCSLPISIKNTGENIKDYYAQKK